MLLHTRVQLDRLGPATFLLYDPTQPKLIHGTGHAIKRRQAHENLKKATDLVHESERLLGVEIPWTATSKEYLEAAELVRRRRYRRCLDELERLVVQRIFELTKMNKSQTGEFVVLLYVIFMRQLTQTQAINYASTLHRPFKPGHRQSNPHWSGTTRLPRRSNPRAGLYPGRR